jgi:hypothetical protein
MKTSRFFVYSLALTIAVLFGLNILIGYAAASGYASALGSAFRKGLEVSVVLSIANWIFNRLKDLNRRLRSTIEQVNRKIPK